MKPLHVVGMHGLGDNLYQRPFVRAAAAARPVFIETPWPEIYSDLVGVFPVFPDTRLRTQAKNQERWAGGWEEAPDDADQIKILYGPADLRRRSITSTMERKFPFSGEPIRFDLPADLPPLPTTSPYAIVRPVTVRSEWRNEARNPNPEYVAQACANLRARGIQVILVADLERGREWLVGDLPPHDSAYLAGEFGVRHLLALVAGATAAVGGVGWLIPAALAAGTPLFVIQGGLIVHNGRSVVTDQRMDVRKLGWVMPDRPCYCEDMLHNCRRKITGFDDKFDTWAEGMGL